MKDRPTVLSCSDNTKKVTIHLPCQLAQRVDKYAKENGNSITGVVIEALDTFLRGRKVN